MCYCLLLFKIYKFIVFLLKYPYCFIANNFSEKCAFAHIVGTMQILVENLLQTCGQPKQFFL